MYFGYSAAVSGVVAVLVATWYVYPKLSRMPLASALIPLLLFSAFRANGLFFLVPGVSAPDIPQGFVHALIFILLTRGNRARAISVS